jgi:hypothetical protein
MRRIPAIAIWATLLAAFACVLPIVFHGDEQWGLAVWVSIALALGWIALCVAAFVRHRKKGLWVLVGLPLAMLWPGVYVYLTVLCQLRIACL